MNPAFSANWDFLKRQRFKRFLVALFSVFAWGFFAHGFAFANLILSHDSLNEFYIFSSVNYAPLSVAEWKISLGRFLEPVYQIVFRGAVVSPWMAGMLSLIWLSLSVWIITELFNIDRAAWIILISGFMTVNLSVIAMAATYITDLDSYMFAVLCALCAVYLWKKGGKASWFTIPLVVAVLSLYQSMISVTVVIILLISISEAAHNENPIRIIKNGFKAVLMISLGGIIYLLLTLCVCKCFGIDLSTGYNGLSNIWSNTEASIWSLIAGAYQNCVTSIVYQPVIWPDPLAAFIHVILGGQLTIVMIRIAQSKTINLKNKILFFALVLLVPLGMNVSYVLDKGMVHDLMKYAFYLFYLVLLILVRWYCHETDLSIRWRKFCKSIVFVLILIIIYGNVQTANTAYIKKETEQQSTLSIMNHVANTVEATEGYQAGNTAVAFVGTPVTNEIDAFTKLNTITGLHAGTPITEISYYNSYFLYILQKQITVCDESTTIALARNAAVKQMPCFPEKGSVQWVDNILVVKFR